MFFSAALLSQKVDRMTRNDRVKKIKARLIVILALVCALSSILFYFTACSGGDDGSVTDPTYTYTEPDDGLISNADFSYNLEGRDLEDFPITAPTGWSKTADNATASSVNSGVVDVSEKGWEELLNTLYDDSDFINYVRYYNKDAITAALKEERDDPDFEPSDTELNDYIRNHKADYFANPGKYSEDGDDYVYMLNNYTSASYTGFGTAQKVTSSSTVTVAAGKNYKLSVNVKTVNLRGANSAADYANIRLTNSLAGTSQAEYRISGINTNGEWKNYTIYIKGDADYDATFTLVLGLGYGGSTTTDGRLYTEGTAFFDDVVFEEVEELPASFAAESAMLFGSEDKINVNAATAGGTEYLFDMSLEHTYETLTDSLPLSFAAADGQDDTENYYFTRSNVMENGSYITSKNVASDSSVTRSLENGALTLQLNKASYTVRISSADLALTGKTFAFVTFDIVNGLSKFGSVDITVDVFEKVGNEYLKTAAVATFSESSEDTVKGAVLFRNNFDTTEAKEFYIEIVVGPADVMSVENASDFATGTVTLSNLKLYKGSTEADDYKTADYADGTDNPEYKLFEFFGDNADATVALYKGYNSDYTEETDETYSISTAPGSFGEIVSYPAAPQDYYGITSNHVYITEQTENETLATEVNDRVGRFTGNYAGLINTGYMDTYVENGASGLQSALEGAYTADENIQPLVIFNGEDDHYGFIGNSNTLAASAYARVSVTLRVVDLDADNKATAYVYLVDTAERNKTVMDLTVNDDTRQLMLTVTPDMMDDDGWVTVDFYVGVGATAREMRVEVWNGSRDGAAETASSGYVFVKDITVTTSGAFTEPESASQAFTTLSGNPLAEATRSAFEDGDLITYTRPLNDNEEKFNKEYPESAVTYSENYVWAVNDNMVYAIYNTLDPLDNNPYDDIEDDTTDEGSGCNATSDPSTFWLSFSSILLAAVLIAAIIALIVKRVRRKAKARRSDAKSHYKVKSRIQISKDNKKVNAKKKAEEQAENDNGDNQPAEEDTSVGATETENAESAETPAENRDLDEYVYGEVQDFGDAVTNEDKEQEDSSSEDKDPNKDSDGEK